MGSNVYNVFLKQICKFLSLMVCMLLITTVVMGQSWSHDQKMLSGLFQGIDINQDITKSEVLNKLVSVKMNNVTILSALLEIAEQAGLKLVYETINVGSVDHKLTVDLENVSVNHALWDVLKDTGFRFAVSSHGQLIIMKDSEYEDIFSQDEEYQQTVTGQVIDAQTGEALPGVNVIVVGSEETGSIVGSQTGLDGEWVLDVPEGFNTLVFSYIGYQRLEVEINERTEIEVALEQDLQLMDEVVVVGFGTRNREDVTGAVSFVQMDRVLGDRPITDAAQALQGAIPGLQVTHGTGQPGQAANLNIRGFESINGGSPLVLVDNLPMSLDDINPRDIESVTVLKDASAASIYGAEAAFGVILITTKSVSGEQPMRAEYSSSLNFTRPSTLPQKATPLEFATYLQDIGQQTYWTGQNVGQWIDYIGQYDANPSAHPGGYIEDPNGLRYFVRETDTYGEFLDSNGFEQLHNISISGGSARSAYRASLGYNNEDGIMVTNKDRFQRLNANLNVNTQISDAVNTTFNVLYRNSLRTSPMAGNWVDLYYRAINLHSATPVGYHETGNSEVIPYSTPANMIRYGPVRENNEETIRFFTKVTALPVEWFELNAEYTFERKSWDIGGPTYETDFVNPSTLDIQRYNSVQSSMFKSTSHRNYNALNLYGKFEQDIGFHKLHLMSGMNLQTSVTEGFSTTRRELISTDTPGLSTSTGTITANDSYTDYGIAGFFGRFNYHYDDKYLLEINARYDGSSRFPQDIRFGFFPSASIAWKVDREPFMQRAREILSGLKLRASWGEIGNQAVEGVWGNYPYLPIMSAANANWINPNTGQRAVTLNAPGLVSADYGWERVRTLNFGVDIGLLDDRIYTAFDLYNRYTLDMLAGGEQLPSVLGANPPLRNVADLKTSGWELDIKWRDRVGDLEYSIGFNLFDHQTEITKFNNEEGLLSQYYVGQNIGEIWGYITEGYYAVDDFVPGTLSENLTGGELKEGIPAFRGINPNPGDVRYKDLDGDGEIFHGNQTLDDPGDRTIIGNNTRRYEYGINGYLAWKNFDFSFLIRGIGKRDLWIGHDVYFPYILEFGTVYSHQLDYWTPQNPDAFYPRNYPNSGGNYGNNRNVQSKYLTNGAYLRIQNITIGYSLSPILLDKLKMKRLRFFVTGENLFNFDNLPDGINADLQGVNRGGNYPFLRKLSIGLNVTF